MPRERSRSSTFLFDVVHRTTNPSGTTINDTSHTTSFANSEEMTDEVNMWPPRKGEVALSPLVVRKQQHIVGSVEWMSFWDHPSVGSDSRYSQHGNIPLGHLSTFGGVLDGTWDLPLPDSSVMNDLRDKTITAAAANAQQNSALALVTLAELGKTAGTGLSYYKDALRLLRKVKQLKKDPVGTLRSINKGLTGKRVVKSAADQWLRYRYGLRTTMFEIQGLLEAINDGYLHTRGRAFNRELQTEYLATDAQADLNGLTVRYNNIRLRDYSVAAGFYYGFDKVGVPRHIRTLGIDQILPTVWELVPFSFIVDWFLNTGDYFASLPPLGAERLGSYVTEKYENTIRCEVERATLSRPNTVPITQVMNDDESWRTQTGYSERVITRIDRQVNPGLPLLPSWNIRFSGSKLADLLALFVKLK